METTYNLELLFKDDLGKSKKINVRNPRTDLDASIAEATLNAIVDTDIFVGKNGDNFAAASGARYVTRTVEDIYQA